MVGVNGNKRGFTLIELLVVIVVLSMIAGVSGSIFMSVIRSNNKANIYNEIQQNGNIILQVLESSLRNARAVTDPDPETELNVPKRTLTYLDKDNNTQSYRIRGGKMQKKVTGGNWEDISNSDTTTGVYIEPSNSYFMLISSSPQAVKIVLALRQGVNAPGRIDYKAKTTFQTIVSLRNY